MNLGDPDVDLNRTFLQPSPIGGVDTIPTNDYKRIQETDTVRDKGVAHVTLRIGTLLDNFDTSTMRTPTPHRFNAGLNHKFNNYSWVFAPRLGDIGLAALEPFETIIDYPHRLVVLIRLDSAGRRLAQVPAYTPQWSTPLIDIALDPRHLESKCRWGIAVRRNYTLDTVDTRQNTVTHVLDTSSPFDGPLLGYPFLSHLGVVGFNHRTRQFILYHTTSSPVAHGPSAPPATRHHAH